MDIKKKVDDIQSMLDFFSIYGGDIAVLNLLTDLRHYCEANNISFQSMVHKSKHLADLDKNIKDVES